MVELRNVVCINHPTVPEHRYLEADGFIIKEEGGAAGGARGNYGREVIDEKNNTAAGMKPAFIRKSSGFGDGCSGDLGTLFKEGQKWKRATFRNEGNSSDARRLGLTLAIPVAVKTVLHGCGAMRIHRKVTGPGNRRWLEGELAGGAELG